MARRMIEDDNITYTIYGASEIEAARESAANGEHVLIPRECADPGCHDQLLGSVNLPEGTPPLECEDGHHNTRPGVRYW